MARHQRTPTRLALAGLRNGNALARQMAPLRQAHAAPSITPAAPTGQLFGDVWQDLRYAARIFGKQPGFAAAAVMTLALGIGATTAIFSVVYGVLLKPLPFRDPERLVSLLHRAPGVNLETANQGPATYLTYRDNQRAFEATGAWDSNQVSITGRGDPEQVEALSVTDTTLPLLGVQPHLGRLFNAEDVAPGRPLRTVLTYGYWQRRFGGVDEVIGQSLQVDGEASVIIGVLPASFTFLRTDPVVVLPMQLDAATAFRGINFDRQALARLKPGVTLDQANADVARMIPLLPDAVRDSETGAEAPPAHRGSGRRYRPGAVGAPGGGWRRPGHRLRQRREPFSHSRRRAATGAHDAGRTRSQPNASGAGAAV